MKKSGYYAVARGRMPGIYRSWTECERQVKGYQNARYKKFGTEKEALEFVVQNSSSSSSRAGNGSSSSRLKPTSSTRKYGSARPAAVPRDGDNSYDGAPVVYTDGACSSNGHAGAAAGYGVYWGEEHPDNISEPLLEGPPTNNRAELMAVIKAIERAAERGHKKLIIRTDSKLLINSLDLWITGWRKKGWKTASGAPVKNQDLIEQLDGLRRSVDVRFEHVNGHVGILGNERADELARKGASHYKQARLQTT